MNDTVLDKAVSSESAENWYTVCGVSELSPFVGVRALLHGKQIAIFRTRANDEIYAVDAIDPFSGAAVLSRGIVGDLKGELVVASPIYKQHFSLETGICQEDPSVRIAVYDVRVVDGRVQVAYRE